jgi:uncharacterized CHY-type Zn-finger protein
MKKILVAVFAFSGVLLLFTAGAALVRADSVDVATEPSPVNEGIQTPAPPLSPDYFPCTTCHERGKTNNLRRVLKEDHVDIVFDHDAKNRWCLDCHAPLDRDKLHLASGELIDFGQSYRLCGQCHGPTYRDWKIGIHGKRTGMWNGRKNYFLCVHCHDPHSPSIKPIEPFPAPERPVGKPFILGARTK